MNRERIIIILEKLHRRISIFLNHILGNFKKYYKTILLITGAVIAFLLIIGVVAFYISMINGSNSMSDSKEMLVQGKNLYGDDIESSIQYNGKKYIYKKGLVNICVLGVDKEIPMSMEVKPGDLGQTDALYLVSLDTVNNKMTIIGIPRDTMIPIEIYNSENNYYNMETMQITLQYAYGNTSEKGVELTSKAVSALLYDLPIQRALVVNMKTIALVNDAVGGVPVTIEKDFTDESGEVIDEQFIKGMVVTLKGEQALKFVMERDCSIFASSMDRVSRQEQYIDAFLIKAKQSIKSNLLLPVSVLNKIKKNDYAYTDLKSDEIIYLASKMLKMSISTKDIITVPGEVRKGERFEEFYPDTMQLEKIILDNFYYQLN